MARRKAPATEPPIVENDTVEPGIKPVDGKYLIGRKAPFITFNKTDRRGKVEENAKVDFLGYSKVSAVKAYSYNPDDRTVTLSIVSKGKSIPHPIPIEKVSDLPNEDLKNSILDQVIQVDGKPVRLRELAGGDVEEKPKGILDDA